jgi:GH25 family lysozyme M1 (1,4-beta-N-acetylmuramidase)
MLTPVVADMNHNNPISWSDLTTRSGLWGLIHKATEGPHYHDSKYAARRRLAEASGLLWGAYDFASGDPPEQNANDFLAYAGITDRSVAPCLDYEQSFIHSNMTALQARIFLDTVDQKTGRACWIYGGNWVFERISTLHMSQADVDWWRMHPLWLCQYKIGIQPDTYQQLLRHLRIPRPWGAPSLIQYTGDGVGPLPHSVPGLERGADLNVFGGTKAQLTALWYGVAVDPETGLPQAALEVA